MPTFELDRLLSYDDDSLLAELQRVAALVKTPYLTATEFDKHSKAHSSAIRRRFGGWRQALTRANLEERYSGNPAAKRAIYERFTDERLIAELRAVSDKIGSKLVTTEAFNQVAEMNAETVRRRFGSWWAALKKAGLTISNLGKRYSEDEYFENLLAVWTHFGRQPKYGEMDSPPSTISSNAYEKKWGTWRKALLAFLDRVNADSRQDDVGPPSTVVALTEPAPRAPAKKLRVRPTLCRAETRPVPLRRLRSKPGNAYRCRAGRGPYSRLGERRQNRHRKPSQPLR
jgi:hypothetical protein